MLSLYLNQNRQVGASLLPSHKEILPSLPALRHVAGAAARPSPRYNTDSGA